MPRNLPTRIPAAAWPANLLTALRAATAEAHRTVEQHPLLAPLAAGETSLADYQRVLNAFLAFYQALEPDLEAGAARLEIAGYRYQRRAPLLKADLHAIGLRPCLRLGQPTLPTLSSRGHLLGILYVVEGSTQGGQVIGPRLYRQLGLTSERGARYFHLFRRSQWELFRGMLERDTQGCHTEAAVMSAQQSFASIGRHLDAVQTDAP